MPTWNWWAQEHLIEQPLKQTNWEGNTIRSGIFQLCCLSFNDSNTVLSSDIGLAWVLVTRSLYCFRTVGLLIEFQSQPMHHRLTALDRLHLIWCRPVVDVLPLKNRSSSLKVPNRYTLKNVPRLVAATTTSVFSFRKPIFNFKMRRWYSKEITAKINY